MEWFRINSLQADPAKFQFLVPEIKNERPFHTYINQVKLNTQTKKIAKNKNRSKAYF